MYADAFFMAGDLRMTLANHSERPWSAERSANAGALSFARPTMALDARGEILGHLLGRFANNNIHICSWYCGADRGHSGNSQVVEEPMLELL